MEPQKGNGHATYAVLNMAVRSVCERERDEALGLVQQFLATTRLALALPEETLYLRPMCPKCGAFVEWKSPAEVPMEDVPCPTGCAGVYLLRYQVQPQVLVPTPAQRRLVDLRGRRL